MGVRGLSMILDILAWRWVLCHGPVVDTHSLLQLSGLTVPSMRWKWFSCGE